MCYFIYKQRLSIICNEDNLLFQQNIIVLNKRNKVTKLTIN
jgi:hypothetical protein